MYACVQNQCAYGVCALHIIRAHVHRNWKGAEKQSLGVNGRAVRFSKSGGPLVETLSESKSFLERQTLLIFLLFSIFFYVYIKS